MPALSPLSRRTRIAIGVALALFPLLVQIPFNLLVVTFDYPDILRRPASEVLARVAAGGEGLTWTWYAYAMCVVPFLVTVIALPEALAVSPRRRAMIRTVGVISAITQLVGLLRWTLVVPALASAYAEPTASQATRDAIAVAFDVQHRLFGNLLGEHVGQLTLAMWTLLIAGRQDHAAQRWLGRVGAILFLVGLSDGLATVIDLPGAELIGHVPLIAFIVWTVWMVTSGVSLVRRSADTP